MKLSKTAAEISWDSRRVSQIEEKEQIVCVHAVDVCAWIGSEHIFEPRAPEPLKRTHFPKTNVSYLERKIVYQWKNQVYIVHIN